MDNKIKIHTETIEGEWKHAKKHVNGEGGTRDYMIQERLDEYIFFITYLRDQPFNVFVMLKLLAKYGELAFKFVEDEKGNENDQSDDDRIYYRCEDIEEDEEKKAENDDVKSDEEAPDLAGYNVDDNGNLIRYNEYGDIVEVHYADPENRDLDLDEQISQLESENDPDMINDANNESIFDVGALDPLLYEEIMGSLQSQ